MTFLFEDVFSGEIRYVDAPAFGDAISIFESRKLFSDSTDFEQVHIYVRIM